MISAIRRYFDLDGRKTTVGRELRGALATFLTMSYILFVNPGILQAAGVPFASAVACTAAAAGLCSLLMGLTANFPLALASGMGLNALIASAVQNHAVDAWQTAMGLVVLDGVIMLLLVLCGLREAMLNAIPRDLRRAIGVGIGLFIAFIGTVNARIVVVPPDTVRSLFPHLPPEDVQKTVAEVYPDARPPSDEGKPRPSERPPPTLQPVSFGSLANRETAIAVLGLIVTAVLIVRRVTGAIVLGIVFGTVAALIWGVTKWPAEFQPPSFANAFQADVVAALRPRVVPLLLAFVLVNFFDALGTVTAIAEQAGLNDEAGQIPRLRDVLLVESASASIGGVLGASSVTVYVESAAGVAEGARTGLHSVAVGLLFLLAILAAPLAGMVPAAATAPAMILVGFLMAGEIAHIDFTKLATAIPAFVTMITVPFTYSIAHGIGYGFLTYVGIQVLSGKLREVHWLMVTAAALFAVYFIWGQA